MRRRNVYAYSVTLNRSIVLYTHELSDEKFKNFYRKKKIWSHFLFFDFVISWFVGKKNFTTGCTKFYRRKFWTNFFNLCKKMFRFLSEMFSRWKNWLSNFFHFCRFGEFYRAFVFFFVKLVKFGKKCEAVAKFYKQMQNFDEKYRNLATNFHYNDQKFLNVMNLNQ